VYRVYRNKKCLVRPADVEDYIDLKGVEKDLQNVVTKLQKEFASEINLANDCSLFENIIVTVKESQEQIELPDIAEIYHITPRMVCLDLTSFPEYLTVVEKAVRDLKYVNLNPVVEGSVLKVQLPVLTKHHSQLKIKQATDIMRRHQTSLRKIKVEAIDVLQKTESIPKDLSYLIKKQIDVYIEKHKTYMRTALEMKKKTLEI